MLMFTPENVKFVFQLLFFETLFAVYLPKRSKIYVRYFCGAAIMLAVGFLIPIPIGYTYLFLLLITGLFVMTIFFWWFCLKCSAWHAFFVGIAGYAAQHMLSKINMLVEMYLLPDLNSLALNLLTCLWMLLLGAIIYFVFARQLRKNELKMDNKQFLFMATVVLIISVFISGSFIPEGTNENIAIDIYAITCCILSLCLLMNMVKYKNLETKLEIVTQLRHKEKAQYVIAKENIDAINIKCHDIKHQLRAFYENPASDKTVLKDIESTVDIYDSFVKTGNDALNVVLAEKSFVCKKQNISLSCIVDGEKLSFISDADIYSMFGNIMDNAVEAVSKLENVQERRISLRVKAAGNNMLSVCEENRFVGELTMKDGLPCTTKENKRYHGFGMRSIAMTVEKYGGVMNLSAKDGLFTMDILFQIPQQDNK